MYNHFLRLRTDAWYERQERVGFNDTCKLLTGLKQEPDTLWLQDVSNVCLQQSLRNLDAAFKNFFKNRSLAKAISNVGWHQLTTMLGYKAEWYGRSFVQIDKWYPSSKRCHACGHTSDTMPLSVRFWDCPACGVSHDRDINAAINILKAGKAILAGADKLREHQSTTTAGHAGR